MKCIVGMSGGVDSSVSALLMKQKGFDTIGCTFKMFDSAGSCRAVDDAKQVAEFLGIRHETIDCRNDFKKYVMDYFVDSYGSGTTPNPCVMCNKFLKFKYLDEIRERHGADLMATGHYARTIMPAVGGEMELHRAQDSSRDQSYFLYALDQTILSRLMFPLGEYNKPHVRKIAEENGIHVAQKSDSQDICFIPDNDYISFLRQHSADGFREGNITDSSGAILGRHRGIVYYTVGQRKGLGLSDGPFFVQKIDVDRNEIIVSRQKDNPQETIIYLRNVNFINGEFLGDCKVQVRLCGKKLSAGVAKNSDGYFVRLHDLEFGIAPGQSCVFFDNSRVIGGGVMV
ncbi:MAG: tRNA 2-thiouridine(34) synthase MnmA [Holosporaceae bacterium]|jgi:tRNA-specific 2-thiouridylase|nr:tRNA 2-thiouridine(34) synthase MnmA [Holosporaceae bacterium]